MTFLNILTFFFIADRSNALDVFKMYQPEVEKVKKEINVVRSDQ